jgi:poly-gamma-glutamate synthesis protein (capsule biosynthesis protein)
MNQEWRAFFSGDIVIQNQSRSPILSNQLQELISTHNIVSCNFEAPILKHNAKAVPKAGPHIHQHANAAEQVLHAGFNLISLANNHIGDYGIESLINTLKSFKDVVTVGAGNTFKEAYTMKIVDIKEIKVGFLSFAEWGFGAAIDKETDQGGFAWIQHPFVNRLVRDSKCLVDVLILQIHAGAEDVDLPLPEFRARYQELIELGVDVIIGHHPHVPQGWEMYKGGLIFYSLGNFYFDTESQSPFWNKGYAVSLYFDGKTFKSFQVIPIERTRDGVDICKEEEYLKHLNYLCSILETTVYTHKANQQAIFLWNDRYKAYYQLSVNGISNESSLTITAKTFIKWLLQRNKTNNLLLLHNIKIESHRYTVERALMLLEDIK